MKHSSWSSHIAAPLLFLLAVPTFGHAFDEEECSRLLQGCLTRPTFGRDTCFQSAATSPTCIGSRVGDIASKRAQFSPLLPEDAERGPGFLGPQTVDRPCLDRFDMHLGIMLDMGSLTSERIRSLTSELEKCTQTAPPGLYRP